MADQITGRWAAISAPTLETPERRARYERTKRQVLRTREAARRNREASTSRPVGKMVDSIRQLFKGK